MTNHQNPIWNGSSFWHGTSSIFLKSIRETGLGAINPATDYKLLDLLQFLYTQIHQHSLTYPVIDIHKASIEATISQSQIEHNGQTLNFRHEGIYVSASQIRASFYACLNMVGSELLEKCLILLSVLIDAGIDFQIPKELDVIGIIQHLEQRARPIMIEVMCVKDEDLVLENGGDASEVLRDMRDTFPKLPISQQFEQLQFINFRLLKPVGQGSLRFYEVEFEGHPKYRNYEFYLNQIQ